MNFFKEVLSLYKRPEATTALSFEPLEGLKNYTASLTKILSNIMKCFGALALAVLLGLAFGDQDNCGGCQNGECRQGACLCERGFIGSRCETNRDNCVGINCNEGVCQDGIEAFTCSCNPGFIGEFCETNKNDCRFINCNYGTCIDGINAYHCLCDIGYEGDFCDVNEDDCVNNNCSHGTCVDGIAGYTCKCNLGYAGTYCDQQEGNSCNNDNTNPCKPLRVSNLYYYDHPDSSKFIQCSDHQECFVKDCAPGTRWSQDVLTCVSSTAVSSGSSGGPNVAPTSSGYTCASNNNPCSPSVRVAGQYYYQHVNPAYFVQCSQGGQCYEMPCAPGTQWSQSHLTCIVSSGGGSTNYCTGVNCNNGWCENGATTYTCHCNPSYTGRNCDVAVNSGYTCQSGSNPCSPSLRVAGQYYYQHTDPTKFVQCSEWGQCYEMPCGPGTRWSQAAFTCVIA